VLRAEKRCVIYVRRKHAVTKITNTRRIRIGSYRQAPAVLEMMRTGSSPTRDSRLGAAKVECVAPRGDSGSQPCPRRLPPRTSNRRVVSSRQRPEEVHEELRNGKNRDEKGTGEMRDCRAEVNPYATG